MAARKQDVPVRSRWAPWKVLTAWITGLAGLSAIVALGFNFYDRWTAKPPSLGTSVVSISIPPVVPAPEAKLVAHCVSLPMRASLEALVKRVIEQHDALYKARLNAMQQALPPARRNVFATLPDERDHLDVFANSWLVNGYLWCRVSNVGNKPARDVRFVVTGVFRVTFYDGSKLAEGGVAGELPLGEIRPEFRRDVEIFSEHPGGDPPGENNLKLTQADGENGKVSFAK